MSAAVPMRLSTAWPRALVLLRVQLSPRCSSRSEELWHRPVVSCVRKEEKGTGSGEGVGTVGDDGHALVAKVVVGEVQALDGGDLRRETSQHVRAQDACGEIIYKYKYKYQEN